MHIEGGVGLMTMSAARSPIFGSRHFCADNQLGLEPDPEGDVVRQLEELNLSYENLDGSQLTRANLISGGPVCRIGQPENVVILLSNSQIPWR